MKTLFAFVLIALVAIVLTACGLKMNPAPKGQLVSYEYSESGTTIYPTHYFFVGQNEDSSGIVLTVKGMTEIDKVFKNDDEQCLAYYEKGLTVSVDSTLLDSIKNVIVEHKMQNYKDTYRPPFEVLDGYSWHYRARFDDGTSLYSSGYNSRPNDDGLNIINTMLFDVLMKQQPIKQ